MNEECLICKAPLTYLEADMLMECEICHKKENSKTRCVNGHYVCNECHTQGLDRIIELCMTSASSDPKDVISSVIEKIYCGRLVMAVTGFITIVAAVLLCVCIHEFIHMLGYKLCRCNCVLVYSKPLITISVMGSEWLTKKQALFVTLLPFLVIDALSFFVFLITKNSLLLMWLLLINTALAGSDLVCVFVLAKTPKSSLTLGHYMRKQ